MEEAKKSRTEAKRQFTRAANALNALLTLMIILLQQQKDDLMI